MRQDQFLSLFPIVHGVVKKIELFKQYGTLIAKCLSELNTDRSMSNNLCVSGARSSNHLAKIRPIFKEGVIWPNMGPRNCKHTPTRKHPQPDHAVHEHRAILKPLSCELVSTTELRSTRIASRSTPSSSERCEEHAV